jgi:hypothetical protein
MEALIKVRHRASGYDLRFQPSSSGSSAPEELRDRFYSVLAHRSHGLPLLVMYEWLRSLRLDTASRTLVAESMPGLNLQFLDTLDIRDLILLGRILVHAGLTPKELSRVHAMTSVEAEATLRRLGWTHLVELGEKEQHVINPVLCEPLRQVLTRSGIL